MCRVTSQVAQQSVPTAGPYLRVTSGSCEAVGYAVIEDVSVCETAASSLGLTNTNAGTVAFANNPYGCIAWVPLIFGSTNSSQVCHVEQAAIASVCGSPCRPMLGSQGDRHLHAPHRDTFFPPGEKVSLTGK